MSVSTSTVDPGPPAAEQLSRTRASTPAQRSGSSRGESLLPAYLGEIGRSPMLGPDKERALARRFRRATAALRKLAVGLRSSDYSEIFAKERLTLEDAEHWTVSEAERFGEILTKIARNGKPGVPGELPKRVRHWQTELDRTREALTVANLRLVVHVARKHKNSPVPLLDLIQEGNIGLLQAIDRYDPEVGVKLSTYAYFWIRQAIDRAVAKQGDLIVKPYDRHRRRMQVAFAARSLFRELGRQPSIPELASRLKITERRVEQALSRELDVKSLEEAATGDSGWNLADRIEDTSTTRPEERLLEKEIGGGIHRALNELLTPRQRWIVVLRFGLDGGGMRSLEDVGKVIGLSRERVRQIEVQACAKLRKSDVLSELYGTLGGS